jgi:hypothetical protein
VIIVYHHTLEPGAVALVERLRKKSGDVVGFDLKYFNGEPDRRAKEVYSPKYIEDLARLYGDKYKTKPRGRRKQNAVRNDK